MKLTKAEYRLLAASEGVEGGTPAAWLIPEAKELADRMCAKGLLKRREWISGYVVATAAGRRSYSRGVM